MQGVFARDLLSIVFLLEYILSEVEGDFNRKIQKINLKTAREHTHLWVAVVLNVKSLATNPRAPQVLVQVVLVVILFNN